jgi:hypothetical protein
VSAPTTLTNKPTSRPHNLDRCRLPDPKLQKVFQCERCGRAWKWAPAFKAWRLELD